MKICYIMRGIPGSGKSTVAKSLATEENIFSTDKLFYVDGEYKFNPARLKEKHEENFRLFSAAAVFGASPLVCDNTNTKKWEMEKYISAAEQLGYLVAILTMPHPDLDVAAAQNIHKVPKEAIARMLQNWEN